MIELKPCPFCGGEAAFLVTEYGLCVKCKKCYNRTAWASHKDFTLSEWQDGENIVEEVAKRWNRRQ